MNPEEAVARLLDADESEIEVLLSEAAESPEITNLMLDNATRQLLVSPQSAHNSAALTLRLALLQDNLTLASAASRVRGQALRSLGRNLEAIEAFETASDHSVSAGDTAQAARFRIGVIESLSALGRNNEAVSYAKTLKQELQELGLTVDAAKVAQNVGNAYYRQGRFHDALRSYEEAAETIASLNDPLASARVDFNRANILFELMEAQSALELFNNVRDVFAENGIAAVAAMAEFNIGVLYHGIGQYAAALSSQQRAKKQFVDQGRSFDAAKCDADMADVYRSLNLHSEALQAYDLAIAEFTALSLDYERGRAELGRSSVLAAMGSMEAAGEALGRAEVYFRRDKNTTQTANAKLQRAYWSLANGEFDVAHTLASSAARTLSKLQLPSRAAEARFVAASIEMRNGVDSTRKMLSIRKSARRYAQGWLECRADHAIGKFRADQGRISDALIHYRAAVSSLESARSLVPSEDLHTAFISNKLDIYQDIVALLLSRGSDADVNEALEYVERSKSRLLLEKVQSAMDNPEAASPEDSAALANIAEIRARLNTLYNQIRPEDSEGNSRLMGSQSSVQADAIIQVEEAYRSALRATEVESGPGLFSLMQVATPADLQSLISRNETLVEFYVVHGSVCAFVVAKDQQIQVVRGLAPEDEIDHLSRRLRYHMKRAGSSPEYVNSHSAQFLTGIQRPLARLYDLLIRPLESLLNNEKITIVPHSVLHGLPFHALYDGEKYVLDTWEVAYAPSATIRYLNRVRTEAERKAIEASDALVMGVPDKGLEQIEVEVKEVARILPHSRVYCGSSATVGAFNEHASHSRMIHLATHALFRSDNPLFSGLRFSDGWLLARDLYTMRLQCDLVTLSACRTGQAQVESGDEMFGLLRGFLAAGARSVAVSLWPAEDAPTAKLMTGFHTLMAAGQSRAEALRSAQKNVRKMWSHPYMWAAFALFGDR